jgi:hypothetical protein
LRNNFIFSKLVDYHMFFQCLGESFNSLCSLQVLSLFLTHFLISPLACEKHFHVSCCFRLPHMKDTFKWSRVFLTLNVLTFQTIKTLDKQLRFKQASWTITCFFHCLGESSTLYIAYKFWACAWLISSSPLACEKHFHVSCCFKLPRMKDIFFIFPWSWPQTQGEGYNTYFISK